MESETWNGFHNNDKIQNETGSVFIFQNVERVSQTEQVWEGIFY